MKKASCLQNAKKAAQFNQKAAKFQVNGQNVEKQA